MLAVAMNCVPCDVAMCCMSVFDEWHTLGTVYVTINI